MTRKWRALVCILVSGLLAANGPLAMATDASPALAQFRSERTAIVQQLAVPIARCVARHDTDHPAFHGCIDWHSSVHGTWALTAYGWATHDTRYEPLVRANLKPRLLKQERAYLQQHPDFEMPYGRAWFLRLAIDRRKVEHNAALNAMADDVADSLVRHFRDNPPEPGSIAYSSSTWALINLYEYAKSRGDTRTTDFVTALVDRAYVRDGACPVADKEVETHEFMALCTNWAWLVGDVLPPDRFQAWLGRFLPPEQIAPPIEQAVSIHQNGLNFSRSWGLWNLYWKTHDSRYLDAYLAHVRTGFAQTESWNGRYETVSHWVAQFGMLGVMESWYDAP